MFHRLIISVLAVSLTTFGLLCCAQQVVTKVPMQSHIVLALHGDVDFTPTERATIHRAIAALAQQTAGIYEVVVTYDLDFTKTPTPPKGQATLVRLDSVEDLQHPPSIQGLLGATHYVSGEAPATFLVMDRLGGTLDLKHVVMHELLHAIGLKHVPGANSLMSPGLCRETDCHPIFCFSPSDAAEFCRIAGCRSDDLPHCEWRSP